MPPLNPPSELTVEEVMESFKAVPKPVNKIQRITSEKELLEVFGKPSLPDISLNDILKFANDADLRQIRMEKKDDGLTPEEQGPCT